MQYRLWKSKFSRARRRRTHAPARRLEYWWRCVRGREVRALGARLLAPELQEMNGDYILQLGLPMDDLLREARARVPLRIALATQRPKHGVRIVCDGAALPLESESMDGVVLAHVLEFDERPHEVLHEAVRVLDGEGRLAILGLNPFYLSALYKRLWPRFLRAPPWAMARSLSAGRLCDWLRLLDMELMRCVYTPHRYGLLYLLVARKRLLRPINMRRVLQRPLWSAAGAEQVAGVGA